jgi:hypothetical protein
VAFIPGNREGTDAGTVGVSDPESERATIPSTRVVVA